MNGKWNNEFREVNLIKEIKLRRWLKASFYDKQLNKCWKAFKSYAIQALFKAENKLKEFKKVNSFVEYCIK
jgi:DNA topoisomerase VI subunit A